LALTDDNCDEPPCLNIYGGSDALPQRLPWQIHLYGPYGCGGTLVSMKVIKI